MRIMKNQLISIDFDKKQNTYRCKLKGQIRIYLNIGESFKFSQLSIVKKNLIMARPGGCSPGPGGCWGGVRGCRKLTGI